MKKNPTLSAIMVAIAIAFPAMCSAVTPQYPEDQRQLTTATTTNSDGTMKPLENAISEYADNSERIQIASSVTNLSTSIKDGVTLTRNLYFNSVYGAYTAAVDFNSQSMQINSSNQYTLAAIGVVGTTVNFNGTGLNNNIIIDLHDAQERSGISLSTSSSKGNSNLTIRDVEEISIANATHGIQLAKYQNPNGDFTNALIIHGTDNLNIGSSENSVVEMRNGIISLGSNTVDISVKKQINIQNSGQKNNKYASSGVSGTGDIKLSAGEINFKNYQTLKSGESISNGYLGSYSVRAIAVTKTCGCSGCPTDVEVDSDIALSAQNINVDTNWGAVLTQSTDKYHAHATLTADNIIIDAAGSTMVDAEDSVVRGQHSAIKAFSGGQESTVNLTAKNQLSLNYNTMDLTQAKSDHDLLFAYGKNAAVNVTAGTLLLNDQKQAIRNVAKASHEGVINMTSENGGVIYGNMTADTHGQIHLNLGASTVFTGNVFDHSFAYKDPSIDGTIVAVDAGSISINGASGAGWNALSKSGSDQTIYYSTVDHLTAASGVTGAGFNVSLAHDANEYSHLNVTHLGSVDAAKNGTVTFDLKFDGENQRDFVKVQDAVGQHAITVTYTGAHDKQAQDNLRQQWLVEDSSLGTTGKDGATFELTGGTVDIGVNKYKLVHETGEGSLGQAEYWYLKRTDGVTPGTDTVESIAGSQRFLHWADMQDLRKRLGEIRYGAQDGAWVRAVAQKDKLDGTNGTGGLKQEYYGVHLGMDRAFVMTEEAMMLGGIDVVYGNAEQETRVQGAGSGDTDRYGMNVYATWAWDNGNYADVIFSGDYYKQSVTTHANDVQQDGKYNTFGLGASVEIGKMISFDASDVAFGPWYRQTWIEPQAQLSYYWLKGKNYALSEQGMDVSIDDSDSLIGRLGVVMGSRWNYRENYETIDRRYVQLSLKGGIKYDFLGAYDVTLNDIQFAKDVGRTTWYYGVGADWQLTDSTQCYAQFERESGDGYDKDYEVSVGVKMNF